MAIVIENGEMRTESLRTESAIRAIAGSTENRIPVWRRKSQKAIVIENGEMRQHRFVGILKSLHIVAFLVRERRLEDHDKAVKTPVSEIVFENNSLLREVDSATRWWKISVMACKRKSRVIFLRIIVDKSIARALAVTRNNKLHHLSSEVYEDLQARGIL